MYNDLESGISAGDSDDASLISQSPGYQKVDPIYYNTKQVEVILLDISYDKKWVSYVSHHREEEYGQITYNMYKGEKRTYLTLRRFTSINTETKDEENTFYDININEGKEIDKNEHFSIEITKELKNAGSCHCKFLSISGDGKFVVVSFFEKNLEFRRIRKPTNPNCLIYKVENDTLKLIQSGIPCNGRAVFLEDSKYSLAIVDTKTVKVYDNFSKNKHARFLFDLHPFTSSGLSSHERLEHDESYIKNSSWFYIENNLNGNLDDFKMVISITRHIRHNILTTNFFGGIVRIWSISEDGVRLTSMSAENQHVMAFSKNYKYAAAYDEESRYINVYNVKSGLLVYQLKHQENSTRPFFEILHVRFCYDGRYLAISGREENYVVFEVWYIEAEELIYRTSEKENLSYSNDQISSKIVQPFVIRGLDDEKKKCLKGIYTSCNDGSIFTTAVELEIDKRSSKIDFHWKTDELTYHFRYELENNLNDFSHLRCGHFYINEEKYLIRFGKHTVQLWSLKQSESSSNELISDENELLYIRAYKGPDYGLEYSFRETWRIQKSDSIEFIGGASSGRMLVNIIETNDENSGITNDLSDIYHTEELFLPLDKGDKFDYHKLESACQALHYFSITEKENIAIRVNENFKMIQAKTTSLINFAIKNIDNKSNFFSTIAGSRTLALLASFESGREIIKKILAKPIHISIFSYPRPQSRYINFYEEDDEITERIKAKEKEKKRIKEIQRKDSESTSRKVTRQRYRDSKEKPTFVLQNNNQSIAANENVLTVLIDELSYDLYRLLFNRILSDSKKIGPGCLSSLSDALLVLQVEGNTDLLLTSSQKLSYLEVEQNKLGVLSSEINQVLKVRAFQKEYTSSIRNLETHAIMEQIPKYEGIGLSIYKFKSLYYNFQSERVQKLKMFYRLYIRNNWRKMFKQSQTDPKKLTKVCVVPFPHFNSYSSFPEDRPKRSTSETTVVKTYKESSAFVSLAIDQDINSIFRQGDTVIEVMLQYKWNTFARWRFFLICLVHAIYYVSYSTGVLFSQELYYHVPEEEFKLNSIGQIVSVTLMGLAVAILMIQEGRQFWKTHSRLDYFYSGYNWIDLAAFVFPVMTFIQLKYGWNYFNEVCSISTLILWTHGILRMRVISYFGITLEIIIQLCRSVASVLLIMLLVIFAFTNAYIVLLRLEPDEYFQEKFGGTFTSIDNSISGQIVLGNISSDNGFSDVFKAFSQVWFYVFGVWDSLSDGDAGDNKLLICISIVFSFITVLIFFNLVIALMSSTVEDVNKLGKKVWVSHFAAVVSEIELLWCSDRTKHCRTNNPMYIYYIANYDSVTKHAEEIWEETVELCDKLGIENYPENSKIHKSHSK